MTSKCIVFVLVFLFFSCEQTNKTSIESIVLTSNTSKELVLDDLFEEFEYISLETSKESIFGEIKKLVVHENRYYILDNHIKKILFFQADGTFVQTIGKIGNGPGEYTNLEDFVIDEENNKIVILGYPSTVYVFDLDGNYIMQKQIMSLPVWNICSYKDGFICSNNHQAYSTNNESLVYLFDKDFNLKSEMGKALANNTLPPFISYPFLKDENSVCYFDILNSTIYLISSTNTDNPESINFCYP